MNWIAESEAEKYLCPFQDFEKGQICITCGCLAWIYYDGDDNELLDTGSGRCRLIPE